MGPSTMRYLVPMLAACSGIAVAVACVTGTTPMASASEKVADTKIAAATKDAGTVNPSTRVVCSRNRPLQFSNAIEVASSAGVPQGLSLPSNIVQLFCRDVRINTIVVHDYCAVIRE
jgi:hypothetical protein